MAENADNDSLSPSRVARRVPSKRRASSVSSDSDSKLAGAAQSVQPLIQQPAPQPAQSFAQPGEPLRDESTLDLFAGDPLHAPVQSTQTGHRQGRFELQEPSTAEAATDGAEPACAASRDDGQVDAVVDTALRDDGNGGVASEVAATPEAAATVPADSERTTAAIASQTSVLAEANGAAEDVATTQVDEAATDPMLPGQALAQLRAARAVAAPRPAKGGRAVSSAAAAGSAAADDATSAEPGQSAEPATASCAEASPASGRLVSESRDTGDFARAAAEAGAARADAARPAPPELNPARAAAFAETIDALNSAIADQRRAAGRMKWMLGAVVGALLVTVVAGVAQTMILSRLATDVGDQQQRIAQMMQEQQAAIAGALARLPSPAEAPVAQAVSQSPTHPAATTPAHHTRHTAAHSHHARTAAQ
jgi:hypothetical protein